MEQMSKATCHTGFIYYQIFKALTFALIQGVKCSCYMASLRLESKAIEISKMHVVPMIVRQ